MSDQCKPCTLFGRIEDCKKEDCFRHDDWYARTIREENEIMRKMLSAVVLGSGNFENTSHNDVDGKNWFDLRDEVLGIL